MKKKIMFAKLSIKKKKNRKLKCALFDCITAPSRIKTYLK